MLLIAAVARLRTTPSNATMGLAALEQAPGKLVITVHQAAIWATFRELGMNRCIPGYGALFAK